MQEKPYFVFYEFNAQKPKWVALSNKKYYPPLKPENRLVWCDTWDEARGLAKILNANDNNTL